MTRSALLATACLALSGATLVGCGPSGEQIDNAMIHRCEMERLEAEMAAAPERTDLRDEYVQRGSFLRDVVETSNDPERLREILAERSCE
jgi:hypothetical protein